MVYFHALKCYIRITDMRIKNKGGFKGKMKKPDSNLIFLYRAILMLQTEEECELFCVVKRYLFLCRFFCSLYYKNKLAL